MNFYLTDEEIKLLKAFHKKVKDRKIADKVKCVVALAQGFSFDDIANILLIDERSARRYFETYNKGGLELLCKMKEATAKTKLTEDEIELLKEELRQNCYNCSKMIALYIFKTFHKKYTNNGLVLLLKRIGFVYKKTKYVPSRANLEEQLNFIEEYQKLRSKIDKINAVILFMDGVHPTYNTICNYAWIEKGKDKGVKSNTARERLNINGAYNPVTKDIIFSSLSKLDARSIVNFIKKLERKYQSQEKIYLICDNARYYKTKLLREYLQTSKVEMFYLPSYSPNLNLIERLWRLMKKTILYNQYYDSYQSFCDSIKKFFLNKSKRRKKELSLLMTENFQLFENY